MVRSGPPDKGGNAEEALADYFRAAGFFAVRGVPFRHDNEDLTDIDVWLYERGGGLERRRFIVDSKNKQKPKVIERLFWTCGLRDALGLDGGFVAVSGAREATRRLARRVKITLIDFQVLGGAAGLDALRSKDRLSKEELTRLITEVDRQREGRIWRDNLNDVLAALLTAFGGGSANVALRAARFYAEQGVSASPMSRSAEVAVRLFFLCAASAAVSLDYVAAQSAFQPAEQRRQDLEDAIRYGTDAGETKARLDLAVRLSRELLPNGAAVANQLNEKIKDASGAIPADMIAEVAGRMLRKGGLFEAARILEDAAHHRVLPSLSALGLESRSFAGAILDFCGIDRARFAGVWETPSPVQDEQETPRNDPKGGPLFDNIKSPGE